MRGLLCGLLLLGMAGHVWAQDDEGSGEEPYVDAPMQLLDSSAFAAGWVADLDRWGSALRAVFWWLQDCGESTAGCRRDDTESTMPGR